MHSIDFPLVIERFLSFKILENIEEAPQDYGLKFKEQATMKSLEKGHRTTKQLLIKWESLRKQTSTRLEEFP